MEPKRVTKLSLLNILQFLATEPKLKHLSLAFGEVSIPAEEMSKHNGNLTKRLSCATLLTNDKSMLNSTPKNAPVGHHRDIFAL